MPPTLDELLDPPRPADDAHPVLVGPEAVGGRAAWQAMVRDGDLIVLHGARAIPWDVPVTPALRAATLQGELLRGMVVARASAVWVHLGGPVPPRLSLAHPASARRPMPSPDREAQQTVLREGDVVLLGGVPVTTRERTALDLASRLAPEHSLAPLRRLAAAGVDLRQVLGRLDGMSRWRGATTARAALRRALRDSTP